MRIGFALPVSGSWATAQNMARVAERADELGYASLWTFQRLLNPADQQWDPVYRSVHDPLLSLGYVAALTRRIRLGLAVVNVPYYAPLVLAKQLTTLDTVCGGRLDVGLGAGWSPEEFTAVGARYPRRGARVAEFVRCLDRIWTAEVVEWHGEFYDLPACRVQPKPVQRPRPPLLLGGVADPALRRAGRLADGWISSSRADLATLARSVEVVRGAAVDAGRDPDRLRIVVRGVVLIRDRRLDERPLTGPVAQVRADLDQLAGQGATELFVDLNFDPLIGSPEADPAESMEHAERLLEEFAPH